MRSLLLCYSTVVTFYCVFYIVHAVCLQLNLTSCMSGCHKEFYLRFFICLSSNVLTRKTFLRQRRSKFFNFEWSVPIGMSVGFLRYTGCFTIVETKRLGTNPGLWWLHLLKGEKITFYNLQLFVLKSEIICQRVLEYMLLGSFVAEICSDSDRLTLEP